ncbi:MAG: LpqB family beta-propeller domain-containing protein [Pyrinomonadaceae bacterium]
METTKNTTISFDEFEVDALKRTLLKKGQAVPLNPKTFDLLLTLVEHRGAVLSKNDLLDKVWENQFVEENNLTVHVAALRKVLGEKKNEHRFIITVPGRGYKFIAELNEPENEIVIESHKFSRILVDEEITENEKLFTWLNGHKPKAIAEVETSEEKQTWIEWLKLNPIMATLLVAFFLLSTIFGGYVWQKQRQSNLSPGVPFAQMQIRQLTTNGKVSRAALSPDGKLFAYVTNDLGSRTLWLGQIEGGNDIVLRPAAEAVYSELAFSPDSSQLYFSMRDDKNPKSALYKMPVFGGAQQKVLDEISSFSLSPDGKRIAFGQRSEEEGKDSLIIASTDGSERREVASFPKTQSFIFDTISWSDDGNRLALSGVGDGETIGNDILTAEISTGEIKRIVNENWREIAKTAWLKDDSGLIVTAIESSSWSSVPQFHVLRVEIPSGKTREITTDRSSYDSSLNLSAASDQLLTIEHRQLNNIWVAPSDDLSAARQITFSSFGRYDGLWGMDWTPDGKLIYTNSDTQSQFISQMNADGSEVKSLTAPGAVDSVLSVSPDGRYIIFHSNRGGGFDIWRTDIDSGNPLQLTFGKKNFQPFVSADSRQVYYKSWEKGVGELRRVSIDGGEPEILNDKETSWGGFSPDGKYFAAGYKTDKNRLAIFSAENHQIVKQFDFPKSGTMWMGSRWTPDGKAVAYRDSNYGYWLQPIDAEARRMEGLPKEKLYNFAWSKDGKQFAFVRGQEIRDVVLISNRK